MTTELPKILKAPQSRTVGLLLESRIPARLAWVAHDGTPRVVPIWFIWSGSQLLVITFRGAKKLQDLTDGTVAAITIDTDQFPYRSLKLRGTITTRATEGLADEYVAAAVRYLGPEMAKNWTDFLGSPDQVVLAISPTWAVVSDMATDSPFMTQHSGDR